VELTGGELRLATMPPRDGELVSVHRIVVSPDAVLPGDVYWHLNGKSCDLELAYLRGALGVVSAGPPPEPWPGCFSVAVANPAAALVRLIDCVFSVEAPVFADRKKSGDDPLELKVLQLCGERRGDIYPLACGRSAKGHLAHRRRRQAA